MNTKYSYLLIALLVLSFSYNANAQISFATLKKLASLNSANLDALPKQIAETLRPMGFWSVGNGQWVRRDNSIGKEIIKIGVSFDGNIINYYSYNLPNTKSTIETIKKSGRLVFNNKNSENTHFRVINSNLMYEVIYFNDFSNCNIGILPYKQPEPIEQKSQNNNKEVQQYKALSLSDLETIRLNPKNNSSIIGKGYVLKKSNNTEVIYVGHLSDSIIVTINFYEKTNKVEWTSGTNREWLYNHLSSEIKSNYEYSSMLSNTDETDNKYEGLPYYKNESYLDGRKRYETYRLLLKEKIIGYGVTIQEDFR